ncbi:nicotinate-nucleotide--dimethylbenzimidazole phosphoribosyltransferase [Halalkalicoccus subterraneus]|uniref:nicotinate-nucleotide--dimethylbenzimidazole phosphoribosyltransferase n=1 Tax=Halalkalicoccus subterraneus TaxID=2675002 RepID=UPI000EFB9BE7|nr:TIGR00303 family protein [Halalkalicoccus subterraneus]
MIGERERRRGGTGSGRLVVVAGGTRTAGIEGSDGPISAAGADPEAMMSTPSADLEILEYGGVTRAPTVPVSPTGCPTPAVHTRAVRELLGFDVTCLDAGLARSSGAPTVSLGDEPGGDIRNEEAVGNARELFDAAEEFGRSLPDSELAIGETVPGGTTTAMAVLRALGERSAVSSSLPANPLALKREVVDDALASSGFEPGSAAGTPIEAVRCVGDPVLAAVAGLITGAADAGTDVILAGGTQLAAAAALARHAGVEAPLTLATTSFVAEDASAEIEALATDLDLDLRVTDPGFDGRTHPAMAAYAAGEAKEGVGMGGALWLAERDGIPMEAVRERIRTVYDRLTRA